MAFKRCKFSLWWLSLAIFSLDQLTVCQSRTSNCSSELQRLSAEDGGEIVSHNEVGAFNYTNNLNCYWRIDAPPGKRIVVWFTYMDLEAPNDKVTLYDGLSTSTVIAAVSASDATVYVSPKFVSTSNILTLNFYSSSNDTRKGFRLEYKTTMAANSSECGSVVFNDASKSSGFIVSHPGYNQMSLYGPSMSCRWTLPAMSGHFYQLTLGNMSLGNGDCLQINRGTSGGSSNVNLCGWRATTEMALQMDGNVQVVFTSNSASESTGFQIMFENASHCPDNRNLTDSTGEIVSHTGVGESNYWNNVRCYWYISAPPGQQVWFWFSYFSFKYYDFVQFRNAKESSSRVTTVTGNSPTQSYQSTSNIVSVLFLTISSPTGLGFKLQYNFTQLYCDGFLNVTATKAGGEIMSHNRARYINYLNNMDCYWQINAPVGQRIIFRFLYTELYNSNDRLTLFDGPNGSTVLVTLYSQFNGAVVSSTNTATVRFNTDRSGARYGFVLWFKETDSATNNTCGTKTYENASNLAGFIESHRGYNSTEMSAYAPNLACLWTLPRRPGFYIYLAVTYSLGSGDCLKIVTKSSSSVPGSDSDLQYCGLNYGSNGAWVTTGDAHISFTTDSLYESTGFVVKFYYEQACPDVQQWDSDNGEIISQTNAGTTHYTNSLTCNWQIYVSPGKQVIAWFTYRRLGNSYDKITLYNGMSGSTTLVSSSGPPMNYGYRSSSSSMRVRFTTDATYHSLGFRMRYSISENFCSGRRTLRANNGEFFSHNNLSSANYLASSNCYWTIVAPPGNSVTAQFTSFSLYSSDYVYIYDGITSSPQIASFSGAYTFKNVRSRILASKSNVMVVYFRSSNTPSLGFGIKYSTTEKFCQNTKLLTNDTGELASHTSAGVDRFLIRSECYWVITVSSSRRVLARFSFFNLTYTSETVRLYDGVYGSAILATLDRTYSDTTYYFLSSENVLTVYLYMPTNVYGTSLGIRMKYEATDAYCESYKLISRGSGEISSHKDVGTSPYVNGLKCTWQIVGKNGIQISANLIYLNLASAYDSLALYDGPSDTRIVTIGSRDSTWPTKFLTLSNILTVTFISGNGPNGLGFRLQYSIGDSVPAESSTTQTSSTAKHAVSSPTNVQSSTSTRTRISSTINEFHPSRTTSEAYLTTTDKLSQTEPPGNFPTYALALAIAVPLAFIAIAATTVSIVVCKLRKNPKTPAGQSNLYTEGSAGPFAPTPNTGIDPYLEPDGEPKKLEDDYYDYIGMKPQGESSASAQLSTFGAERLDS